MKIEGRWLENVRREIADADYCFVCGEHPTHGHAEGCPAADLVPTPNYEDGEE